MSQPRDAVDEMLRQWARERPDLESAGLGIVLRVQILAGIFAGRLKDVLAPTGLAPWEFDVLSALRRAGPDGLTPKQLCKSARLTSGAMTHRIDRLEEPGLVRRRPAATDRRSVTVSLTPKGRALIDKVIGARMVDAAASVGALRKRERDELAGLLRTLSLAIHETDAPR
jgi:DNA-binding MarR family transcriptional regulator